MDRSEEYRNLNFAVHRQRPSVRMLTIGGAFLFFTVMWWILPGAAFYWLIMPVFLVLVWMASYGWRPAVAILVHLLQLVEGL
jgi:hypothetical protein